MKYTSTVSILFSEYNPGFSSAYAFARFFASLGSSVNYELRELNSDATTTIVLRMTEEPRDARKRAKAYAEENPGLYSF